MERNLSYSNMCYKKQDALFRVCINGVHAHSSPERVGSVKRRHSSRGQFCTQNWSTTIMKVSRMGLSKPAEPSTMDVRRPLIVVDVTEDQECCDHGES